jgi:hypothetical protein
VRRARKGNFADLDAAGVISVYAQRRELALAARHPVCGRFMGLTWHRHERVCALDPEHAGEHSTVLPLPDASRARPPT